MENEKNYSLAEVILGKGDKYLDSRIIIMNDTLGCIDSIAQLLQGEFEDNKLIGQDEYYDYPAEMVTLIHQVIRNEDGECTVAYELRITKEEDKPVEKTIYVYDKEFEEETKA